MLDEKTRALLGDREAQEAITARGELLPCQCGGDVRFHVENAKISGLINYAAIITCKKCEISLFASGETGREAFESAAKLWNTRAPLLTPTQMEVLGKMEDSHDE